MTTDDVRGMSGKELISRYRDAVGSWNHIHSQVRYDHLYLLEGELERRLTAAEAPDLEQRLMTAIDEAFKPYIINPHWYMERSAFKEVVHKALTETKETS